jgi:hypothetical protein
MINQRAALSVFLPISRVINARIEETAMMAIIGVELPLLNRLTPTEANAPTPICKAPSKADALPAFFAKGARQRAAAFGFV